MTKPYVSVVAASRNDDHGGNLLHRMQIFIEALLSGCDGYGIDAELVLVEWNPPPDRPRLAEALRWPSSTRCAVRIIEVSQELHDRFGGADALPLHQMIAKNVGIRRAQGDYVVATNVDVVFSEGLWAYLAKGALSPDRFYRVDRHDVPDRVPAGRPLSEQLAFCRENVLRVHRREGTLDLRTGRMDRIFRPTWMLAIAAALAPLSFVPELRERAANARASLAFVRKFGRLHTNASGDFTMMSRERWHGLTGYWEFVGFPTYVDGILCYAARFSGLEECVLPAPSCVYHMEHGHGSGYSEYRRQAFWQGMGAAGVPRITREQYEALLGDLKAGQRALAVNGEGWGLGDVELRETALAM